MHLDGAAVFKPNGEVLDKHAAVAQGLGGVDDALRVARTGCGEHFLGRDVGVEPDVSPRQLVRASHELAFGQQADGEIGAGGFALIIQAAQVKAV